ncbi:MAG: bifunctional hydroxymethylpyrimidine kinase/phosphomethylpyrimidine kinase [Candidatus Coatesbacteria bacterium]|nr:MAG: bifunctional hydroxymethylpyrimidine kinase/phosphomethylpyrimidine kinase [Candidatus Coatesbacteria bacterium]
MEKPIAITIAGHDPSGGAGAAADAITFAVLGCFPATVVTAITYQNTTGVAGFDTLVAGHVEKQLIEVMNDYRISAVKLGMLGSDEVTSMLAPYLRGYADASVPVVCDTVFTSGAGEPLFEGDAAGAYVEHVIPHCSMITPNLPEAETLTGKKIEDPRSAAEELYKLYGIPVLLKGGHAPGYVVGDVLFNGRGFDEFSRPRVKGEIHGTGCLLSAAITAYFARDYKLRDAVSAAEDYVSAALENRLTPGKGTAIPDRLAAITSQ